MTTRPSTSSSRPSRSPTGLWVALGALLVGALVAVLGVRAAVASYQRDQDIRSYHNARVVATYFINNGLTISTTMKRLQTLDDQDVALMESQQQALYANDVSRYNALAGSADHRSQQQQDMRNQLRQYQRAFAEAENR